MENVFKKTTSLVFVLIVFSLGQPHYAQAASPSFRSQASAVASYSTTLTVTKPAGTADGDIMVAAIELGGAALPTAVTPPVGWVLQQSSSEDTGTNAYRFYVYTKIASSEGANYTWATTNNFYWAGGIASYSGGDTVTPVDASTVNQSITTTANRVATSVTTTVSDTTIVGAYTDGYWDATWTPPAGMTERIDVLIGGDWGSISLNDVAQVSVGASGDKTATASISQSGTGILLALRGTAGGASPPTSDTTAPSVPAGLSATAVSTSQINLSWSASTDNVGVTGYRVYRGGTLLTTVTTTSYSNTGLSPSTTYSYTAQAIDTAGNASAQSTSVSVTTQASTPPPTVGGGGTPAIFFSDLDSGPNTGGENNNGVYVTIKGNNFGSTQGTSYVSIGGGQAASYQLWTNTKIIFQLGASAATGNITVTTSNGTSNGIPFTVRAGNIYFVTSNGTGNGLSVSTPMSPSAAYNVMGPGKTFYFRGGTYNQNYSGGGIYGYRNYSLGQSHGGTAGQPMAMVGYPNETATFQYLDISRSNIGLGDGVSPANYVTFANFTLVGGSAVFEDGGFYTNPNSGGVGIRLINNIMSAAYGGANTMTGVILIQNNYWKVLGNEVKNTGTGAPINNNHGIYNQAGSSYTEIAWNYFHDLRMGGVVQVHTDPYYSYYGVSIHDNIFAQGTNGDSRAIVVGNTNGDSYGYIYNNIFDGIGSGYGAMGIWSGTWKIYNNTMYNIHAAGSQMVWVTNAARVNFGAPSSWLPGPNVDIKNNIFYSDGSTPYFSISTSAPAPVFSMDHNVYYNNGAAPTQDTAPITGNPLFVSSTTGDFHLQSTSPAKDNGTSSNTNTIVSKDHDGLFRPQGLTYDIGAYEYASGGTTPPPPTPSPTVTISASPTSITSGNSSTLTWSSTNATSCTASGGWSGIKATSGTQTLTNLTISATYTLSCTGVGGTTNQSITVTVTAPPTCTTFTYSAWGSCQSNNTQSRTTTASSPQGCTGGTPLLTQSCVYTPPTPPTQTTCTSFTYSAWDVCQSDSTQSRTTTSTSPQGCTGGTPTLSQSCIYTPPATTPPPSTGGGGTTSSGSGGGSSSSGGGTTSGGTTGTTSGGTTTGGTTSSSGTTNSGGTSSGETTTTTGTTGGTTTTTQPTLPTLTGPFGIGMRSDQVKLLQQMLIKDGSLTGEATGYYGPLTQRAVETFQIKYNLVTQGSPSTTGFGLAGPGTRAKLNALYAGTSGGMSTDREALLASLRKQVAELIVILQGLITKLAALKAAKGIQ